LDQNQYFQDDLLIKIKFKIHLESV
jgi:hypothetical protein